MKSIKTLGLILLLCLLFIVMATAFFSQTDLKETVNNNQETANEVKKETEKKEEIIKITSQVLAKEYEENEIKADKKYKNKKSEITGEIEDLGEMFGVLSISLKGDGFLNSVHCVFPDSAKDKIAELNKGDTITISGIIEGYGISVDVKNCSIK